MMRHLPSLQFRKCVGPLFTSFLVVAMVVFPAAAETPTSRGAQSHGSGEISKEGDNSTDMSGEAISGSNDERGPDRLIEWGGNSPTSPVGPSGPKDQEGTNAPGTPTGSSPPSAPPVPQSGPPSAPQDAEPAAPKILVVIDKPTQQMKVFVDSVEQYSWEVSTGLRGYDTPSGKYTARSMNKIWYSKEWDDAPMPHAIFFTKKGHAVHGTHETKKLGKPASHGCVRLAPENARILFALVKEKGLENTEIVLNGDTPKSEAKVVSAGARKQVRKSQLKVKGRSGGATAASSRLHKQQIRRPRQFVDRRFDPREFDRGFARRDWARFYRAGPPRMQPPPGYYLAPPRRFFVPAY
jgi:lipoprotein-anchoring transpeptidase ErfK/SrfK